jgi:hypothetical protein
LHPFSDEFPFLMQPFFHILAATIARDIGEDYPKEIIATTIVCYALSSVLTGMSACVWLSGVHSHM